MSLISSFIILEHAASYTHALDVLDFRVGCIHWWCIYYPYGCRPVHWPEWRHIRIHIVAVTLSGQDLVSDIFDKIHFFVQMDSWHDGTYPIKIWSSFVQPKWIYLTVKKPRMSAGQESCRARTSYVPRILQQHAYTSGHKQMQGPPVIQKCHYIWLSFVLWQFVLPVISETCIISNSRVSFSLQCANAIGLLTAMTFCSAVTLGATYNHEHTSVISVSTTQSWNCMRSHQVGRAIVGRTARCRCKFRQVWNFTISLSSVNIGPCMYPKHGNVVDADASGTKALNHV